MGQPGVAGHGAYPTLIKGTVIWDGNYYMNIAQKGYSLSDFTTIAFYPLFPMAVRALHLLGLSWVGAAMLINICAVTFAVQGLYVLATKLKFDGRVALYVVVAWLAFPTAHFMTAFYTEALFCALAAWCLVWILEKRYLAAAMLAALASATRFPGVVLGMALAVQYFDDHNWRPRSFDWKVLSIPLSFIGIAIYWLFLARHTNMLPWQAMRQAYAMGWDYMRIEPNILKTYMKGVRSVIRNETINSFQYIAGWTLIAWGAVMSWRKKFPIALTVYAGLTAAILILSGNFISDSRYALPVFPIFLLIGKWLEGRSEATRVSYIVATSMAMAVLLVLFATGYWVV